MHQALETEQPPEQYEKGHPKGIHVWQKHLQEVALGQKLDSLTEENLAREALKIVCDEKLHVYLRAQALELLNPTGAGVRDAATNILEKETDIFLRLSAIRVLLHQEAPADLKMGVDTLVPIISSYDPPKLVLKKYLFDREIDEERPVDEHYAYIVALPILIESHCDTGVLHDTLKSGLHAKSRIVRSLSSKALSHCSQGVETLLSQIEESGKDDYREDSMIALRNLSIVDEGEYTKAREKIEKVLRPIVVNGKEEEKVHAASTLASIGVEDWADMIKIVLKRKVDDPDEEYNMVEMLFLNGNLIPHTNQGVKLLLESSTDKDVAVSFYAAHYLAVFGRTNPVARAEVMKMLKDETKSFELRRHIASVINSGQDFNEEERTLIEKNMKK